MPVFRHYRFRVLRRTIQVFIMVLFIGGSLFGWPALRGDLSTSRLFNTVSLADPFAVLQITASGKIIDTEALTGAVFVALFFGVFAGRAFCSWVCPLNIVTDTANWLRERTGLDSAEKGFTLSRNARYWAIGVSLAVSFATGVAAFEWISPISMLHRGAIFGMGLGWITVLAVFLFDLLLVKHGFCGHLCPLGGFYSLITGLSMVRVRHCSGKCTLCMRCLDVCPERQVLSIVGKEKGAVLSGECTNCGRCIEICDFDAMKFGIRFSPRKHSGTV